MFKDLYKNKKILVTGHTGFKGSWLIAWLKKLQTKKIIGISLKPHTNPSHYNCGEINQGIKSYIVDLRNYLTVKKIILKEKPDFIFHLAANPLVKESYNNPVKTWETNLMGTINVLEAAKFLKKKMCYGNDN